MVGTDGGYRWWVRMVGEDGGYRWWVRMVGTIDMWRDYQTYRFIIHLSNSIAFQYDDLYAELQNASKQLKAYESPKLMALAKIDCKHRIMLYGSQMFAFVVNQKTD